MTDERSPSEPMEIPFDQLPEKFVESIENPMTEAVAARPAATIVLLREAGSRMEVLLTKRSRSAGFVPGAYVFPGGRVDAADAENESIARLDGLTVSSAAERLELVDATPPAIAYYLAAVREAFEETGILVAQRADGSAPPTAAEDAHVDRLRNSVLDDEIPFGAALEELDCRIDGDAIEYIAHWITPRAERRRYDTRFFAAVVRDGATPIIDPREMTDAVWITPPAALDRLDEGTLPMVFPTIKTLELLADFWTPFEALEAIRSRPIRTVLPTLVVTPTGVAMKLDDDE